MKLEQINNYLKIVLNHYRSVKRDSIVIYLRPLRMTMTMRPALSFLWLPKSEWKFILTISSRDDNGINLKPKPKVLIGFLAHEVAHILDYQRLSRINIIFLGIQFFISRQYRRFLERNTDVEAIMHGFGVELLESYKQALSLSKNNGDRYNAIKQEFYLSPGEISELLKK